MREIIFRGKRVDNGGWVEGAYCAYDSKFDYDKDQFEPNVVYAPSIIAYDDGCLWYRVDPTTVGQYTGLYDSTKWEDLTDAEKLDFYHQHYISEDGVSVRFQHVDDVKALWRGKRIFEGDIVNGLFLFERQIAGVVTFRDGSFGVQWMRGRVEEFSAFTSCCNVAWEVIGNVVDDRIFI